MPFSHIIPEWGFFNKRVLECYGISHSQPSEEDFREWLREFRLLLLGRKVITDLDSIFESRDISLPTNVCLVKAVVFPVVMYGCESWTVKKAECRRIDAFELWCWRTLFESPLDCKEIQPVHCERDQPWDFFVRNDAKTETPVLWPPHAKSWFIGKDPDAWRDWGAEGEGDDRGWDGWMASLTGWTWVWVNSGSWWWTRRPGVLQLMGLWRVRHDWATELNWREFNICLLEFVR